MTIKIIVGECWKLEANWEHEGATATQIVVCPAGDGCPFKIDHVKANKSTLASKAKLAAPQSG